MGKVTTATTDLHLEIL